MVKTNVWKPKTFIRYGETFSSSSLTARIVTDAGEAYLKAINNPEGIHILACDWIGTKLAQQFGLKTFDVAILNLTDLDEIPLRENLFAQSGPAFVSKAERGITMGKLKSLEGVENLQDVALLVVFDTWVRNCDRHAPNWKLDGSARVNLDNIFLSEQGASLGKYVLKAIDHGHIFTCGKPLTKKISSIDNTKDERLYGLFPCFEHLLTKQQLIEASKKLTIKREILEKILEDIPVEWQISDEINLSIIKFLLDRAEFLKNNFARLVENTSLISL